MPSFRLPQGRAARVLMKAYLASDSKTKAVGKVIPITISKDGSAFANPSGGATNAVEIGQGWYYVDLSTTDIGTKGPLIVRGAEASIDDVEVVHRVVDTHNGDFDSLPPFAANTSGGIPILIGTALNYALASVTNLTNAPTAGDLTPAMKASIAAIVPTPAAIGTQVWANAARTITGSVIIDTAQAHLFASGATKTTLEVLEAAYVNGAGDIELPGAVASTVNEVHKVGPTTVYTFGIGLDAAGDPIRRTRQ